MDSALRWHFLRCLDFELRYPQLAKVGFVPRYGLEARRWRGK